MQYYKIVGPYCGRDERGKFTCLCEKCKPICSDELDESYCCCDSGDKKVIDAIMDASSYIMSALKANHDSHDDTKKQDELLMELLQDAENNKIIQAIKAGIESANQCLSEKVNYGVDGV